MKIKKTSFPNLSNLYKITSFSAFIAGHCDISDSNFYLRHLRKNYLVFRDYRRSLRQLRFQSLFAAFATKLPRFPHLPPVIAPAQIPIFICGICDKDTSFSAFTAGSDLFAAFVAFAAFAAKMANPVLYSILGLLSL